jgi:hypothetical protein
MEALAEPVAHFNSITLPGLSTEIKLPSFPLIPYFQSQIPPHNSLPDSRIDAMGDCARTK